MFHQVFELNGQFKVLDMLSGRVDVIHDLLAYRLKSSEHSALSEKKYKKKRKIDLI